MWTEFNEWLYADRNPANEGPDEEDEDDEGDI